jgi:hypothetical protein
MRVRAQGRRSTVRPVEIRECEAGDVAHLERWKPSGLTQVHTRRFQRQERGLGTFLIAWLNGSPVASAEIRWDGCAAVEVQRAFPDCSEINGLQVWPAEIRSQGVGTSLITEAEIRPGNADMTGSVWESTITMIEPPRCTFGLATPRPIAVTSTGTTTSRRTAAGMTWRTHVGS